MTEAHFIGHIVGTTGDIVLDFPAQQRAVCKHNWPDQSVDVFIAPHGLRKTRLQERGFHAMIQPWCREKGHNIDDLKDDLLGAIFGHREHVNPITGEVRLVLREPHTSKLSRVKYSELIERTLQIAAEVDGFILEAPNEYRERKAKEARRVA